ncbi:DUF3017 domain-containing protein [Corynebacterium sp. YSMAA1_1_F7]|uniref:DUF3017 domain-containing protein n=1 Tax=Corynebacterium sp. YSMAA1_1_F7 TaxID=3383590 RepID=UPI0025CCA89C|nr:DUF3017 domain-containing protein [uncultured Corynebacterium sp.]
MANRSRPARIGDARQQLLDNPHDRDNSPSRFSRPVQWALVGIFGLMLLAVLALLLVDRWRRASVMLGSAMVYLAVLRLLLDSRVLGVLAVRSRKFDTAFTAAIGLGILWIAVSVDPLTS